MPKKELKKVLVIGSGPIVIGQSAEFDYSGTQACRALKEEGIEVVLVNSNPATIQTDKDTADRVYIEPLNIEILEKIIEKEKPQALMATVGGQTALNLSCALEEKGILKKYGVEFLGTNSDSIELAESREKFNGLMERIGIPILPGRVVHDIESAVGFAKSNGYPVIIRPSYTLGGTGGGMAADETELRRICELALRLSATKEALVERSVLGWGEFEYEVIRDGKGNCQIICNMENFDPMGIHTGESIVVAPSQTLSDRDHQTLRNAAIKIVNAVGIKGSCNVQFSFNEKNGEFYVIEINPRLSRSSALASKATGYPIARVATKIALGYTLDEIQNKITGTCAAFEPALDYIIIKIPRWPFDKFPKSDRRITTQMKSTGEVMAIGRTFKEAFNKALRSLEIKIPKEIDPEKHLMPATDLRIFAILQALRSGKKAKELSELTKINVWFLNRLEELVELEKRAREEPLKEELMRELKTAGFSDQQIADLSGRTEREIRKTRKSMGIIPGYKIVDSCAGEFEAITPYYYSTYEMENESVKTKGKKIVIVGSGPIRIGQGIEFDYCCTHASMELRKLGYESIMINNNPETVSTDFDTSDRLYFEPLTFEDVMNIVENEEPLGVIVQLGGQTSLNVAERLTEEGVRILGTQFDGIDLAEDRERFRSLLGKLKILQPENGVAKSEEEALVAAGKIGYPVVVRPSYVIAGRAMEIVRNDEELRRYINEAVEVSQKRPVLIDKYLDNAIECEVDAVSDGKNMFIGGIMEHIEPAGIHSGDANIVLPAIRLTDKDKETLIEYTKRISKELGVVGFVNMQYVIKEGKTYVLEANPRASRTVPFVSKAIDVPMTKIAIKAMLGGTIKDEVRDLKTHYCVKSVVFPFLKLSGTDTALGPEMRSTGETMGIDRDFETAYYKALLAAGIRPSPTGAAFLSLRDEDKKEAPKIAKLLRELGYRIYGTFGTVGSIEETVAIPKIGTGKPDILELVQSGQISLVINTPTKGGRSNTDGFKMRRQCIQIGIPCITNVQTAQELLKAMIKIKKKELTIRTFDEYGK
ncbi:carbamoyl-phosphate synthase large subunit [Candidatus Micrarchaeota archaeon]|nr:carbamoyl-phosphate synthase large subunit [Candidatus Micrarchaeota archaeon]